jgi:hypothetical protein
MAGRGGETFAKRQREKARQEKQAAKRARRQTRGEDEEPTEDEGPDLDALMEEFRVISEQHAAGELPTEEFEERRDQILVQLGVE